MSVLSQNEKRYFRNEIDRLPIFRYNRMGSQENEIVLFPICTTESTLLFEKMCICSQIVIKQCFGFFVFLPEKKRVGISAEDFYEATKHLIPFYRYLYRRTDVFSERGQSLLQLVKRWR